MGSLPFETLFGQLLALKNEYTPKQNFKAPATKMTTTEPLTEIQLKIFPPSAKASSYGGVLVSGGKDHCIPYLSYICM
jgi:hypothetical protein